MTRAFRPARHSAAAALLAAWSLLPLCAAQERPPAESPRPRAQSVADWLVDRARDHALVEPARRTALDAALVGAFLGAAQRIDPQQRDALAWLYELALLESRPADARAALDALAALGPQQVQAEARRLELGPPEASTVEARRAWLEAQLARATGAQGKSLVHAHLSRLAHEQGDRTTALAQLDAARRAFPENPLSARLAIELAGTDPAARLRALIEALRLQPVSIELAWQVGELLDQVQRPSDAQVFYQHALFLHGGDQIPDSRIPPDRLMALAQNAFARGANEEALRRVSAALQQSPTTVEYLIYANWLHAVCKRPLEVLITRNTLGTLFAQIRDPAEWPVQLIAQAAWFHATNDVQPKRALELAQHAARRAPGDPYCQRALGAALAASGDNEEARRVLEPIAARDPYAAAQLARLLKSTGDDAGAARVIGGLQDPPTVGPAADALAEFSGWLPATRPSEERYPGIEAALTSVPRDSLAFARNPGRFLSAEMSVDSVSPAVGDVWWAEFSLANPGDFPIVLGAEGVVNPTFVLSFASEGDRERAFPMLVSVALDGPLVLLPGEAARVRRSLNVGPVRRFLRLTPQQVQRVTISAVFDPVASGGRLVTGASGLTVPPVRVLRSGVTVSADTVNALLAAARGDSPAARRKALEVLGDVLGEQQRLESNRLGYAATATSTTRIRAALLAALSSADWETRVWALEALMVCGMDAEMIAEARRGLQHSHWLVRLMTLRLLARDEAAREELARPLAANDPDELARRVAGACLAGAASRPASSP